MVVTNGSLAIIVTIALFVLGGLFTLIFFLFKRAIFEKIDETGKVITEVKNKLEEFRLEIATEYVRKDEFSENVNAHKEIWEMINQIRERCQRSETKVEALEKNKTKEISQ